MKNLITCVCLLIAIAFAFESCTENISEPENKKDNSRILSKTLIPHVFVQGKIYNGGIPAKYALVQCLDQNFNVLTFADGTPLQTTTDALGNYDMTICHFGSGTRYIRAYHNGFSNMAYFYAPPAGSDFVYITVNVDVISGPNW